jgi:hypothetical protein
MKMINRGGSMGWLSGTPKWCDKVTKDLRPDNELTQKLEALRVNLNIPHEFFADAYSRCWFHHEARMRMVYQTIKETQKDSESYKAYGEKVFVAAAFAPVAQNKIGLWFKDQNEIENITMKLNSIDDAIKIIKERYFECFSMLPAELKDLLDKIEQIMENNLRSKKVAWWKEEA